MVNEFTQDFWKTDRLFDWAGHKLTLTKAPLISYANETNTDHHLVVKNLNAKVYGGKEHPVES